MSAKTHKEWEKDLIEVEEFIQKANEALARESRTNEQKALRQRIEELEQGRDRLETAMYKDLAPWDNVLIARAERRPYTLDYVQAMFPEFIELQGDRNGFIDNAIIGGPATFMGKPVMVVGHQKGRNISERQYRNFAMSKPEGYRKAIRLFDMAQRFRMPVISIVDTPAADPGVESESRGISEAIAASTMKMFELSVPSIAVIVGEGGSGGAIGIAASSRVLMLQHAIYSVIPPEGCAAILWRNPEKGPDASEALKLTAESAMELGLIDEIIPEPSGAAHRHPLTVFESVRDAISRHLDELSSQTPQTIRDDRFAKYRNFGKFESVQ